MNRFDPLPWFLAILGWSDAAMLAPGNVWGWAYVVLLLFCFAVELLMARNGGHR